MQCLIFHYATQEFENFWWKENNDQFVHFPLKKTKKIILLLKCLLKWHVIFSLQQLKIFNIWTCTKLAQKLTNIENFIGDKKCGGVWIIVYLSQIKKNNNSNS